MGSKGCWTCRRRKVRCDQAFPDCQKCAKSIIVCEGYGKRLKWPRDQQLVAAVAKPSLRETQATFHHSTGKWVNVVPVDINLHMIGSISTGAAVEDAIRRQLSLPNVPEFSPRNPGFTSTSDLDLLHYFEENVAYLLPALCMQRARVCNMLVQISLSNSSRSSSAVHFAVLALSAYHRGDNPIYVETKKRSALRELYTDQEPSMCEAVTHLAANLILCILEMQQTSERNSRWVGYVCSAKHVIDAFNRGLECPTPGSDASIILSWVYYFDIMFRFSLRHWRTENIKAMAEELGYATNGTPICELQYVMARASFARAVPNIGSHAHPVLRLLAEVSETALYSADPRYLTSEYQQELVDLRFDLENVSTRISASNSYGTINTCQALASLGSDGGGNLTPPTSAFAQDSSEICMDSEDTLTSRNSISAIESLECTENVLEVTRLAALTYLERVSRNFSSQSNMVDIWTRKALGILDQMDSCLCPFALLAIGCEANCDDDRVIILDLFARMEKRPHLKSLLETKALIQTAWNQQDLAEDGELEYIHKLNVVLSSRFNIPSLI